MQGSRNRCCSERHHIHCLSHRFETFLDLDAESLFLIDDHESEILKVDVSLCQAMRADSDIDLSSGHPLERLFLLLPCAKTTERCNLDRKFHHPITECVQMLGG